MAPKRRILPVTGPPGAGKTTALISLAAQHPQLARFGVRDFGLELARAGDPLGLRMRETLLRGGLVSDALVRREFRCFLDRLSGEVAAVAVEGYPRDPRQCRDFTEVVAAVDGELAGLVAVELPDEEVRARVVGRRICTRCGIPAPEGATAAAPAAGAAGAAMPAAGRPEERCAACGGAVAPRDDDAEERLARRLADYRTVSAGVRAYFRARGLLHTVDGLRSPAQVRRHLLDLLLPTAAASAAGAPPATRPDPEGGDT
ncbi:adenylate kinase [Actinacidiphila yanglinensis]|uniref:Adenylate kinase n=1 Tax=Actinacidiphila yanglinensis TaxID=310779 RepID=A0A1H5TYF9_9ACTN|nr:nucleoside monophosphate kinase [Actinacidiphila yanglinensis]SEF67836.1 adenylate kinase [Actinacidiphila yanglinensis]